MINPLNCAAAIVDLDPQLAEPLFDLMVYIVESDDARNNPEIDRALELVYARTEDGTRHRQTYRQKRVRGPSSSQVPIETLDAVEA